MSVIGSNAALWAGWFTDGTYNTGYSQPARWALEGAEPGEATSTDCSALTALAWNRGGVQPPFPHSTWTGSIREEAEARGFAVLDWDEVGADPYSLMPGDAVLSEAASGGVGHVAVYIGGDVLAEAWIAETGDIDGAPGDQTGGETRQIAYSAHPYTVSGRWTYVLRPVDPAVAPTPEPAPTTPATPAPTYTGDDDMFLLRDVNDQANGWLISGTSALPIGWDDRKAFLDAGLREVSVPYPTVERIVSRVHDALGQERADLKAIAGARGEKVFD